SRERRNGRIGLRSSGRSGTSWADMCRMLGIVSRKPAPVDTLLAFRQLADTGRNFRDFGCPQPNPKAGHPDGWGIACIGAEGEIDTQFIYDRFLDSLGTEARPLPEFKQAVAKAKAAIDTEFPRKVESYTFLMLDGNRLIAHRDARTCVPYYTLHETATEDMRL